MINPFKRLSRWYNHLSLYIIADARDNAITISHRLFKHMQVMQRDVCKVFVFRIPEDGTYGFIINPNIDQPTQLSDIQYNAKYRCIGFESLCPTVNRIFYDYGIPADSVCKLSIDVCHTPDKLTYYKILPPSDGNNNQTPTKA